MTFLNLFLVKISCNNTLNYQKLSKLDRNTHMYINVCKQYMLPAGSPKLNKASQAIQSPRTVSFFLLVSLLDGYSFPNVLVKGIVAFEH